MPGFVYILEDDLNKYYIGSCENIDARYKRHLTGWVATTNRMKNPRVALSQKYPTIEEARRIERKLKRLKRKDYIRKIIKDGGSKSKILARTPCRSTPTLRLRQRSGLRLPPKAGRRSGQDASLRSL
ncbi:MAG: GIY-YIG nuclease family protein [Candidatus Doudnabacteria bacterium]|nr:GIY-YIG nuclease family protein [Candidatus Doudnabacteria bacterium]